LNRNTQARSLKANSAGPSRYTLAAAKAKNRRAWFAHFVVRDTRRSDAFRRASCFNSGKKEAVHHPF